MYKEVFKIRIKAARKDLGLSQIKVSTETGIHQSYLSKYESGDLEPNLEQLGILANYYRYQLIGFSEIPIATKEGREENLIETIINSVINFAAWIINNLWIFVAFGIVRIIGKIKKNYR